MATRTDHENGPLPNPLLVAFFRQAKEMAEASRRQRSEALTEVAEYTQGQPAPTETRTRRDDAKAGTEEIL
jgi:hypothetical protein